MAITPVLDQNDVQTTGSYQELYEVTASTIFHGQIRAVALNASGATVKVALKAGATPTDAANIFYYKVLPQYGIIDLTGLVLNAGTKIFVQTDTADVTVSIVGFEES